MVGEVVMRRTVVAAVEEKVRFRVTEYIVVWKNLGRW
jgi:hypothetical protein